MKKGTKKGLDVTKTARQKGTSLSLPDSSGNIRPADMRSKNGNELGSSRRGRQVIARNFNQTLSADLPSAVRNLADVALNITTLSEKNRQLYV